jgi:predicted DCC family thiol-disulfide oxidoreductase YuxK
MLTRPVLLYDGDCGFCRTWIRRLERWDVHQRIQCLPSNERSAIPDLPPLSDEALNRAMHLITPDGRVFAGGVAVPEMLPFLRGGRWLRPIFAMPGIQAVTNRVYAWVAEHRHDFGSGSCEV